MACGCERHEPVDARPDCICDIFGFVSWRNVAEIEQKLMKLARDADRNVQLFLLPRGFEKVSRFGQNSVFDLFGRCLYVLAVFAKLLVSRDFDVWWFFHAKDQIISLSLNRKQEWLFKRLRDPAQKTRGIGAIDQPVIVRERERQNQARLEFVVHP